MPRWALLAVLALGAAAGEPLLATPWDVRRAAEEAFAALARGEGREALPRLAELLRTQPEALIAVGAEAWPLADAVAARLADAGLLPAWAEETEPAAARRAAQLAASADPAAWIALARSAPGTPTAAEAWRRAADLAWDLGRLHLYRLAAQAAGEPADPRRGERWAALAALLAEEPAELPPPSSWERVWERMLDAEAPAAPRRGSEPPPPPVGLAVHPAGTLARADGRQLQAFDLYTGEPLGEPLPLGELPLPAGSAAPLAVREGFIALGVQRGRLVVVASDPAGRERWRRSGPAVDSEAVGRPVAFDGLVAIPYRSRSHDQPEVRVLALRRTDGAPAWDSVAGLVAQPIWVRSASPPPALARMAAGLALCSQAGTLALLASDGRVLRVWSYPAPPAAGVPERRQRRGSGAGDGWQAVFAPADHPGLLLVLGPDDAAPRAYRGNGADGEVLAVQGGEALLAGRSLTLLDLARLQPRWQLPWRAGDAQGVLGAGAALAVGEERALLVARGDGQPAELRVGAATALAVGGGLAVLGDRRGLRALGDAPGLLERLRAATAVADAGSAPFVALGALAAARGDEAGAISAWRAALARGADASIAERLARLLRARLTRDGRHAARDLALLGELAERWPPLAAELPLWQGLLAERGGDLAAAAQAYATVLAGPDHLVALPDGGAVSLRLLAEAGLARCRRQTWDPFLPVPPPPAATPAPWRAAAGVRGRVLVGADAVYAFADGLLQAWSLADGRPRWWRSPQRALLGVQPGREPAADGVAVQVLPGSAAEAAGLASGDVILALDGEPVADFEADLRPRVLAKRGGEPFRLAVRRGDGTRHELSGRYGGEPLEPLALDGGLLLVRGTLALAPGRGGLLGYAIDAGSGRDRWTFALSQDEQRAERQQPLLVAGTVVAADGADLVGYDSEGAERWRHAGLAERLGAARALPGGHLWLAAERGEARLLDAASGRELARLPARDEAPAVGGGLVAARDGEGRLVVWDLGTGRRAARSGEPARALAIAGDGVLALDARLRPAVLDPRSGAWRRLLAEAPCEAHALDARQALLLVGGEEPRVLALALPSLNAMWALALPPGAEVVELQPAADGALLVLREGRSRWALRLDARGQVLACHGWSGEGSAVPLPGGHLLLAAERRLAVLPPGLPTPDTLPLAALPPGADPAAWIAERGLDRPAGPELAAARRGGELLVAVRIAGGERELHLADAVGVLARRVVRAVFGPQGVRVLIPGPWALAEQGVLATGAGAVCWARWLPAPDRAPGLPSALLLDRPHDAPWWLLPRWRRLADAP